MKHVRNNKFRGFWSLFRSTRTSPLVGKILQRPIRERERGTNRKDETRDGISKKTVRSIAEDFRSSESSIAKGTGARQGIKALQEDILSSCNQLLNKA